MNMQVVAGRSVGFITLGVSLHEITSMLKAEPKIYTKIEVSYNPGEPLQAPVIINLPANGLRLRFDGPDQRLRLIEVLDFTKMKFTYRENEIYKVQDGIGGALGLGGASGPKFRHIYDKLLGPTFAGEYIPPTQASKNAMGIYILSYPGIAFSFPVQHSAYSPAKDFISLLSSSATLPATSMAVFAGESWPKACPHLYSAPPAHPRSLALVGKDKSVGPDEVEVARIHGEGRVELIRRSGVPFWIVLSETTPQDLVIELGPPDAIYRKSDRRLSIHKDRTASGSSDRPSSIISSGNDDDDSWDSEQGSPFTDPGDDDDHQEEDEDEPGSEMYRQEMAATECFYNYFSHGFDIFISHPTQISPPSPTAPRLRSSDVEDDEPTEAAEPSHRHSPDPDPTPINHLTATKIIFHGNVPGSYQFNRHRRSRWTLDHVPSTSGDSTEPLTSEMPFKDIQGRLKEVFAPTYASKEEMRSQQRGMALNRGWGDSPGSSCEFLGGWEESAADGGKKKGLRGEIEQDDGGVGNTELYGFPGMVFEVLKNGAVSTLTVY